VVTVVGRLDTATAPAFDAQIAALLEEKHKRVLLDVSRLVYLSSLGLRSILKIIKSTAQNGGRTGIFSVPPQVMELIEISGFQSLLDIYPDRESALTASRM
jgi:anti-anti-sigma factor